MNTYHVIYTVHVGNERQMHSTESLLDLDKGLRELRTGLALQYKVGPAFVTILSITRKFH